MNSGTVLAGNDGPTSITLGTRMRPATGAMSPRAGWPFPGGGAQRLAARRSIEPGMQVGSEGAGEGQPLMTVDHRSAPLNLTFPLHGRAVRILQLYPICRSTGLVTRADALAHNTLVTKLARVLEY